MAERTPNARTPERPNTGRPNSGEPRLAAITSWSVLFASFGLSASTWIALAELGGYTGRLHLPFGMPVFALAWLMPVAFDGYVVTSLILWTAPVPDAIVAFARKNTYAAASVGVFAQSAYHLSITVAATHSAWRAVLATLVGAVPPGVAALAVHMRALIRRNTERTISHPSAERSSVRVRPAPSEPVRPAPNTEHVIVRPALPEQPNVEPAANVRPIGSGRPRTPARTNTDVREQRLQAVRDAFPDWRTNAPSVRDVAKVLNVATSTAHPYQQELARGAQPLSDTGALAGAR